MKTKTGTTFWTPGATPDTEGDYWVTWVGDRGLVVSHAQFRNGYWTQGFHKSEVLAYMPVAKPSPYLVGSLEAL